MHTTDYLIAGSSHAALEAINAIRMHDGDGSITVVTRDPHRPYSPTVLPYVVSGRSTPERVFLRDDDFFTANKVDYRSGCALAGLDPAAHQARLADGSTIGYRKLLLATGASPIGLDVPGAKELAGYGLGYSIATHAHLLAGKSVAVVGSTIRALRGVAELARTATQVYLVAPDARSLETPFARALRRYQNVELLGGAKVEQISGDQSVEQLVVTQEGRRLRLNVDAAFVDLGLRPNSDLVSKIAQTTQDGFIWIDDRNATTVPGLFAAGDVTTSFGEQILIAIGEGARAALSAYDYLLAWLPVHLDNPAD